MKKTIFSIIIILTASISYANTIYITGSNHVASVSYNYYKQAVGVVADGDKKAFDTMISEKKIFILKEGLSVYVVERKFPGTIKIRLKGTTSEAWTAKEAIKKQR